MPADTPGTFAKVADNGTAGAATPGDPLQSIGARRIVRVRTVGFTQGAAFLVVGAVVAAFVLRNAFVAAHRTVGWVVACSIVAMLVDPLVGALQRLIPRWLSIVVVVLGFVAVFVAVVVGLARELLDSLDVLEQAAPRAARQLEERYDWASDIDVSARVQSFLDDMHDSVRESTVGQAIGTVPTYLVTGILMLFLLGYGRRYFLGALKLFDDLERRRTVRQVATVAAARGREFMLVTLAMALAYGTAFGLLCWAIGVPAPLSLGAAVAIMSALPLIGVVIGGVPALLLAFGSLSWFDGALVLAGLVTLQAFEALVVRPYLDRRAIRVGPTLPTVVGLLSYELYGIGGAIYGVALAVLALAALDAIGGVQGDDDKDTDIVTGAAA
jgi:predicted PurR-regulated permease PerM